MRTKSLPQVVQPIAGQNPLKFYRLKERYYHKGSYRYIFISPENTEVKFDAYGDSYTGVKASPDDKAELIAVAKSLQEKIELENIPEEYRWTALLYELCIKVGALPMTINRPPMRIIEAKKRNDVYEVALTGGVVDSTLFYNLRDFLRPYMANHYTVNTLRIANKYAFAINPDHIDKIRSYAKTKNVGFKLIK